MIRLGRSRLYRSQQSRRRHSQSYCWCVECLQLTVSPLRSACGGKLLVPPHPPTAPIMAHTFRSLYCNIDVVADCMAPFSRACTKKFCIESMSPNIARMSPGKPSQTCTPGGPASWPSKWGASGRRRQPNGIVSSVRSSATSPRQC